MPPSHLARRRAITFTMAAAALAAPVTSARAAAPSAGADAGSATTAGGASPSAASQPFAGGASVSAGPVPAASGATRAEIVDRQLTLSASQSVAITVRAREQAVRVRVRVGSAGRKVAEATLAAGEQRTLRGGALRGEGLHLLVRRADGTPGLDDITVGQVRARRPLRSTTASWYGPGLYGNRTACGQTLTRGLRGVAHKSLPCGTTVTVKFRGRTTRARVVDRGPFHAGREFDLTYATASAIGFRQVGRVQVSS